MSRAAALLIGALLILSARAQAGSDPLPSWNDGAAKQAIVAFVKDTTTQGSAKFVPPEERIASFDQDGTTWVEQPMYSQVMYCLHRVGALAEKDPKLRNVEPFKTVLSGDREKIAKLGMKDLEKKYAYDSTSKVGTFSDALMAEAKKNGWVVVSMNNDRKQIFAFEKQS